MLYDTRCVCLYTLSLILPFPLSIYPSFLQESVVANLSSLDTLITWVQKRKGGREVVRQAIEALQELFGTVLLPDRKLVHFEQRPLQVRGVSRLSFIHSFAFE